jgi:nucleoside-diphosphate-sugar epimerase
MKVLFIGGTGIISSACSNLAIEQGIELYHLNRGNSMQVRAVDNRVITIHTNVRDYTTALTALRNLTFDVVVDWISFLPSELENNFRLFGNRTNQYIFISSASAYQTPPAELPVTEKTPLDNPFWQYSRDKIACEQFVKENSKTNGFNYTIVRPSHTYDKTTIPISGGYTTVHRMKHGKQIIIPGDGTSIWTLTHHRDFATGLVGLLGNPKAMNEDFHITSDEWLTWNQIYGIVANAFGYSLNAIHIPSDFIAPYDTDFGAGLLGDKSHSMLFDNSKIKKVVPEFNCKIRFEEGFREVVEWYLGDSTRHITNTRLDEMFDIVIADYQSLNKQ